MANGKQQASNRRTIQPAATAPANMRDRFGAAYMQSITPNGTRSVAPGSKFLRPGFGPAANKVLRGELDALPDRAFKTEEEVFGEQQRKLAAMGFTLQELNTPVLKPNGQPFMIGFGRIQVPAVMGDLLLGEADEPFDNEVAGDVRRYAAQAKQQGRPLTNLVADKFGGRKDTIIGVDSQGNANVINVQTQGTESASKIMRAVIPGLAAAGIVGLGAFGPGGVFTSTAAPAAATGGGAATTAAAGGAPAAAASAVPAATTAAAGGGLIPTAAGGAAAGAIPAATQAAGGAAVPSFLSALTSPTALQVGGTLAGGLIAANAARGAGETAAEGQLDAARISAGLQRDILAQALAEQQRQEQRNAPFRQAALGALPQLQEVAGRQLPGIDIDPNLLSNLPGVPQFQGPDLTNLRDAITALSQGPQDFELSPAAQAAIDIGTRTAERRAAAQGFTGSGNLLAELTQLATEQASLDFLRQQQLDDSRRAATIDALTGLATLEAGTEADQIQSSILQRELARQGALDPINLQIQARNLEREDITDQFNRLGTLAVFAPGTPQVTAGILPTAGQIGLQGARFTSQAGQGRAAGQLGVANTLAQTTANIGSILGRQSQNDLLSQLLQKNQAQNTNIRTPQVPSNLGLPPAQFQPSPQIRVNSFLGGSAPATGADLIGQRLNTGFLL